jgi:hypothetical protein
LATDVRPLEYHAAATREGNIGRYPGPLREVRAEGYPANGGVAFGRGLVVLFIFNVNLPCASFCRIYLVFSPYYIRLCSPPPVESRATSGQAPLQRGRRLIYTRNTHRGDILMCLLESWLIYFRILLCRSNGSINYTARTIVRLYVSLEIGQSGGPLICFECQ